jgi:EAL domain-containing protein (putative c-di-GMP-specific phosphodiesterase class I)
METRERTRVLVVDDEQSVATLLSMALQTEGHEVDAFCDAEEALAAFRQRPHDVVLTDLCMPGMDGMELLRAVREVELDTPVLIVTASPSLDSAIRAVQYGATRYLVKPVDLGELAESIRKATLAGRLAKLKRMALSLVETRPCGAGDEAALDVMFSRALSSLYTVYQPVIEWRERRILGYEALVCSADRHLPSAAALLDAAERVGRLLELGRASRDDACVPFLSLADASLLFLNVHPATLKDEVLYDASTPLSQIASRVVLEITERESLTAIDDVPSRVAKLREMGFRIAVDDLGAGYAGLTTFSLLQPDVCKLDMGLIRDVDQSLTKQRLIRSLVGVCNDLAVDLVAEGVETAAERDHLAELGCNKLQGYLFARPAPVLPEVAWT